MSIPDSEQRKLFLRSGGRCAFRGCRRVLMVDGLADRPAILGEMAHIVGESPKGPRGDSALSLAERNRYENLVLLCNTHHQLIDSQPQTYTVSYLLGMKEEHERWVEETLGPSGSGCPIVEAPRVTATVYSTLLPVEHMPRYVYGVPCELTNEADVQAFLRPLRGGEMAPYIIRAGMLWAFQQLDERGNPFEGIVDGQPVDRFSSREWWDDPDRSRWFVDLLNRSLNKLTGRRGLYWDREHKRFYFPQERKDQERWVEFRPLNHERTSRRVVWQPKRKATGEPKKYWYHRAVALRFHRVGDRSWCLSLRPEMHVTQDGEHPVRSELIGRRVNKKFARQFNNVLLAEVNFWRDFLGDSKPRILLPFGSPAQHVRISTNLMEGTVSWPGIPEQFATSFANAHYTDDLFTWAQLQEALGDEDADVDGEWVWDDGDDGDEDDDDPD